MVPYSPPMWYRIGVLYGIYGEVPGAVFVESIHLEEFDFRLPTGRPRDGARGRQAGRHGAPVGGLRRSPSIFRY